MFVQHLMCHEERFQKIMTKIKALQDKMEIDKAKRAAKHRVHPPKEPTHTSNGAKILSLPPQPVLS